MNVKLSKAYYQAFGLSIKSEMELPELIPAPSGSHTDVEISHKDLTKEWSSLSLLHNQVAIARKGFFFFKVPGIAIFQVKEGNQIAYSPLPGAIEDKIRLYVLGTCMGALLLQKKILPLHGSAVVIDGKAYAFVGDSGAGKSTLSSVFVKKGCKLLSDDLIAIQFKNGVPYAIPAYPQQKLWETSLLEFAMNKNDYSPLVDRESKYAIPRIAEFSQEETPLAGIFELTAHENTDIRISPVKALEQIQILALHTFRRLLLGKFDLLDWHFQQSTQIAKHTAIYRLMRPTPGFTAPELAECVIHEITRRNHR